MKHVSYTLLSTSATVKRLSQCGLSPEELTPFRLGLSLLVLGRFADAVTTIYGLRVAGVSENNPYVASLISQIGIAPALAVFGTVSVLAIVVIVETGVWIAAQIEPAWGVPAVRLVGYGFGAILSFVVAVQNAVLIGRVT